MQSLLKLVCVAIEVYEYLDNPTNIREAIMGGRTRNLPKNAPIILLFSQKFEKLSTDLSPFTNELASIAAYNRPKEVLVSWARVLP